MSASGASSAPATVAIGDAPVVVGRGDGATLRLLDATVSRRHATVTRAGAGLAIVDHDSRFGTFGNGLRVRSARAVPGDRVRFGAAPAYRVRTGGLVRDDAADGISLEVAGLAVTAAPARSLTDTLAAFRRGTARGDERRRQPVGKTLVEGVSFRVRPDAFVGILGPSGAGKSTVLNCLASYQVPARGRLIFDDGRDAVEEPEAYRALLGHVPQDDVVFRSLTVREYLTFAARLRLGAETGHAGITAAVAEALERVGLAEHADKPASVLSGGQRKRLSVAIELLRRPRLLLLDEPTSGLDPAGEAHLMEQLRHVARRGTTVVCTTHLMENVRLLDEVVVLGVVDGVGRVAYAGPPGGMLAHFGCRGFADLYEVLASGQFNPIEGPGVVFARIGTGASGEDGEGTTPSGLQPIASGTDSQITPPTRRVAGTPAAVLGSGPVRVQFLPVAGRALRLVLRDRGLLLMMLAQPVLLGLLVSLTQYDTGEIVSLYFFAVVVAIWLGLNNAARDLVRERRQYVRDRLAGLRPDAYLAAKTAVHALVGCAQLAILIAVLRLGCGATLQFQRVGDDLHATSTPGLFLLLLACYLGGVGLGLLTSTLAGTEEAAVATLPLLIMPQLLLSVVATGTQARRYEEPRPFRPLVVTVRSKQQLPGTAAFLDVLSMACLSRPAVLIMEAPDVDSYRRWIWLADLCHLVILIVATWAILLLAFLRAERRWLRLIGLG